MTFTDTVKDGYRETHERILALCDELTDKEFAWSTGPAAPSIAFHVWHVARYADYVQEIAYRELGGDPSPQIWVTEELAKRWGMPVDLGFADTGMTMDDEAAAQLPLPAKDAIVDYARRVFDAAGMAVGAIEPRMFDEVVQNQVAGGGGIAVGRAVLAFLTHDNRHLGMIEALRGVQGLEGTATQ